MTKANKCGIIHTLNMKGEEIMNIKIHLINDSFLIFNIVDINWVIEAMANNSTVILSGDGGKMFIIKTNNIVYVETL